MWAQSRATKTSPIKAAGVTVQYQIKAVDTLKNILQASGNYTVKNQPKLNLTVDKTAVYAGQNITVTGILTPSTVVQ